ncbi:hypothetical protein K505DRAFT_414363 [Melanomma pulvis-pyrius CBS 109.77]|uniref:Zn(2)-C6 fungal-type domain-containing protein n=1 Tax=Melanomma pulvis-pyrius CBS 109.77 TaxID=1314802 RepID=A0A6A6XQJ7_9PLEO|nr:hypothetical protein K505DRAFT_414363 [Melanomma pulvis-pyrius CBS 109.77]
MVFYGAISKGCERCRKRKIRCDQRKPSCFKCEKLGTQCPGYRKLDQIVFRDETKRITRKIHQSEQSFSTLTPDTLPNYSRLPASSELTFGSTSFEWSLPPLDIYYPLSHSVDELGANFFFAKYTSNEAPFSGEYYDWLIQSYYSDCRVLRTAIEAVGMAGIANVSHTPHILSKSKIQYCKALNAMKRALDDPIDAISDTTFMAVILLGQFETVNFETWDRYEYWAAHVHGAMVLLELRGKEQFTRQRGGLLFVLIRSQILIACLHQHVCVPPALVRMTYSFQTSAIRREWQHRNFASPGSICGISFRIVNLMAAVKNGNVTDSVVIREIALQLDSDLMAWKAVVSQNWRYYTIDTSEATSGVEYFEGKRHVYPNLWVVEIWNSWRTLRILVNQIILQNEARTDGGNITAPSIIHQLSTDICISASSLKNTPRIVSLIRPLYAVALQEFNTSSLRCFAAEQLRWIGAEMGIRQASLLADTVFESILESTRNSAFRPRNLAIPLIPFF